MENGTLLTNSISPNTLPFLPFWAPNTSTARPSVDHETWRPRLQPGWLVQSGLSVLGPSVAKHSCLPPVPLTNARMLALLVGANDGTRSTLSTPVSATGWAPFWLGAMRISWPAEAGPWT